MWGIAMMQVSPGNKAGTAPHVTSHKLERPQRLVLSCMEAHMLETHAARIRSWGWAWTTALQADIQPGLPANDGSRQNDPASQHGKDSRSFGPAQSGIPGHGAELRRPPTHQLSAAVDEGCTPQNPSTSGSSFDDGATSASDDDDSGALIEATLLARPLQQVQRAAKRRHLGIPQQQQTRSHIGSRHHADDHNVQAPPASAVGATPHCGGGSCSETTEAASISLTHLACVLGTALNSTELQVGAFNSVQILSK